MSFRFAAAVSQQPSLYQAIAEVVTACREGLAGARPDFCQLLITTAHARDIAHAPKCLFDKLVRLGGVPEDALPVVMGGVLQAVCGPGKHVSSGSGVSLLAAALPGVQLMPFHVDSPVLPQLSSELWSHLLTHVRHRRPRPRSSFSSTHIHVDSDSDSEAQEGSDLSSNTATVMLASPDFHEVERLLRRFSNVLPEMPLLGGVTQTDAWLETEHEYGALFLGNTVHCRGAVGCVMHGPLAVSHVLVPGFQPAGGKVMTVTQSAGNVIQSVDGRPLDENVVPLIKGLLSGKEAPKVYLGVNEVGLSGSSGSLETYDPRLFVAREINLTQGVDGQTALVVSTPEVPLGSKVKLLVQDFDTCKQQQLEEMRRLQVKLSAADPMQMALLGYSCNRVPGDDSQLVHDIWPQVPFAGGRMQGEFAGPASTLVGASDEIFVGDSAAGGTGSHIVSTPAKRHNFSASMGLICHADVLQQ